MTSMTRRGCCLAWLLVTAPLAACAGDSTGPPGGDAGGDAAAVDALAEPQEDALVSPDAGPDASRCADGTWTCSDDAVVLRRCDGGAWVETDCMRDEGGRLCQEGVCVLPWRWGAPTWGTCADEPLGTVETLAEKAAAFDDIARRLHVHPDLGWIMSVRLEGQPPPSEATATWADVKTWRTGENDGLWNGLYIASQAFRYAATGSAEALENLEVVMAGEVARMAITGVPGVFTRQYIPPGVPGIACPTDDAAYTTDIQKDDNRWVQVTDEGCVRVIAHATGEWTTTDHCGLEAFAGYCWLDNVSQDEYAGHMLALAAVAQLVDDPELRATAEDLIEQVGVHLMDNELNFVDWDGRVTEHGKLFATSFAGTPGFLASEALAFVRMAATVSGRADLLEFYEGCLLQLTGQGKCLDFVLEVGDSYLDAYLPVMSLYLGPDGCTSNFNNFSMVATYLTDLIWYEIDPGRRAKVQAVLDSEVMRADSPRAMLKQQNAWFDFIWAAMKRLGPDSDGPAYDAVEDGVCALRQFPASKARPDKDPGATYPHYCDGRLGDSQAEHPVPVAERCPRTFLWWSSPYDRGACTADPAEIQHPADYLLAYWMGRYYGFIDDTL